MLLDGSLPLPEETERGQKQQHDFQAAYERLAVSAIDDNRYNPYSRIDTDFLSKHRSVHVDITR